MNKTKVINIIRIIISVYFIVCFSYVSYEIYNTPDLQVNLKQIASLIFYGVMLVWNQISDLSSSISSIEQKFDELEVYDEEYDGETDSEKQ